LAHPHINAGFSLEITIIDSDNKYIAMGETKILNFRSTLKVMIGYTAQLFGQCCRQRDTGPNDQSKLSRLSNFFNGKVPKQQSLAKLPCNIAQKVALCIITSSVM